MCACNHTTGVAMLVGAAVVTTAWSLRELLALSRRLRAVQNRLERVLEQAPATRPPAPPAPVAARIQLLLQGVQAEVVDDVLSDSDTSDDDDADGYVDERMHPYEGSQSGGASVCGVASVASGASDDGAWVGSGGGSAAAAAAAAAAADETEEAAEEETDDEDEAQTNAVTDEEIDAETEAEADAEVDVDADAAAAAADAAADSDEDQGSEGAADASASPDRLHEAYFEGATNGSSAPPAAAAAPTPETTQAAAAATGWSLFG